MTSQPLLLFLPAWLVLQVPADSHVVAVIAVVVVVPVVGGMMVYVTRSDQVAACQVMSIMRCCNSRCVPLRRICYLSAFCWIFRGFFLWLQWTIHSLKLRGRLNPENGWLEDDLASFWEAFLFSVLSKLPGEVCYQKESSQKKHEKIPWTRCRKKQIQSKRLMCRPLLGGGFNVFFSFSPVKIGEDEPNLTSIFFRWVETTNQFFSL